MCFSKPKIEKADPVAPPPPPPADKPVAPILNDVDANKDSKSTSAKRKGRSSLTIPLTNTVNTGINIPR